MLTISIISLTSLIVTPIFLLYRNEYTGNISIKVSHVIYMYSLYLLQNDKYDNQINYYNKMKISYDEYLLSFWKWDSIDMIKPEYREELRKFL